MKRNIEKKRLLHCISEIWHVGTTIEIIIEVVNYIDGKDIGISDKINRVYHANRSGRNDI